MNYNNFKIEKDCSIQDLKNYFISMENCQDIDLINKTEFILDTFGRLGNMNAALGFNLYSKERDFKIYFKQNFQLPHLLIKSIFHEMIHLRDFNDFVEFYNAGKYDGNQYTHNDYFYFLTWSEYHAQYKSFELMYKYLDSSLAEDYIDKFFELEESEILSTNKHIDINNYKKIIRFIARLHLISQYSNKYKDINIIRPNVIETINFFTSQEFHCTYEIFKKMSNFECFIKFKTEFREHINRFRNIDKIQKDYLSSPIF